MELDFNDSPYNPVKWEDKMTEVACTVLDENNMAGDNAMISVSFVSGEEIQKLNRQYRDADSETDVLSFPQFASLEELVSAMNTAGPPILLGDVIINTDRVRRQAEEFAHSEEREMLYLFTHSILHLLGYDHEDEEERAEMRRIEEKIMTQIGLER